MNNSTYETVVQDIHGCVDCGVNKEKCLEAMQEDSEVQFHWSLEASDLEEAISNFSSSNCEVVDDSTRI